jgi:6-pyruvoyltetrahydropterin/6-carboxytetrahydropterin synthase
MKRTAERYHDISTGHRVVGHENKCRHLHGHNYRIHFRCEAAELDNLGRVIDFGVIKEKLCMWLEKEWDHKFLAWEQDSAITYIVDSANVGATKEIFNIFDGSIVFTPFNPTAENMAEHLVKVVGPRQLQGTGVTLISVRIEETAKCSASFEL